VRFGYDLLAMPYLLVALACGLIVAAFTGSLVLAALRRHKSVTRYGDPALVLKLESFDAAGRRATKSVLLVLALVLAFLALGRPQWGRGTKLVPATNLDVVIVLDFSKSMYARDVVPSRIARAKAELAKLIRELPGATARR
jgi:Ca-activated chloride channel homolog